MADTQWPRYQVLLQAQPGSPHQDVGSVHAPDPEIALLNARDVFVRRPQCASLWIVPVKAIYSRTRQEMQEGGFENETAMEPTTSLETYYVFGKTRTSGTQVYLGSVEASSPSLALRAGVEAFSKTKPVFAWWVFPAREVTASDPSEIESLFKPAQDKPFRLSTDFHTVTAMKQLKLGKKDPAGQDEKDREDGN
jgi:ring-1,2-phenylacetyl-CoA epoxidase subunit PaaB